ncbi:MAG: hypothetical protein BGO63_03910 [Candidatus Accumulibacter sp. 66-26]|nr:MAG: hypothetical protein BGO63_03910 [Candidatus Accumulibacter sp. 66-26]
MAATNEYSVWNPTTRQSQEFTSPKEAGAAFFHTNHSDWPCVIHTMPGNRARIMAGTSLHGLYADGEQRFVKDLPNSHKGDQDFRSGYMEALESSVIERLRLTDWEKSRPAHPAMVPHLDNQLAEDLETLARSSREKAVSAWRNNAPSWAMPPAYADLAWARQIAQCTSNR